MSLDRAFRLSFYLTLALACACLGYAEHPLLPEMALLVWPMGLALLAGFLLEGRWSMSSGLANAVAMLIAGGVALWTLYRLVEPPPGAAEGTPLPVRLLPHLGFLLVVLMLALLFRPKQLSNYWFLYAICFVAVALACALDSDFIFGLLLLAFLASGLWSLALFYLWCGLHFGRSRLPGGTSPPDGIGPVRQAGTSDEAVPALPVPWRGFGIWQAVQRCLLIAILSFVFFSLTPRAMVYPWDFPGARGNALQSGLGEPVIDLNRTGTVRLSKSVAFEVIAEDAQGRPKLDLDAGQHWRCLALNNYENGRWFNSGGRAGTAVDPALSERESLPRLLIKDEEFPDLGPRQFFMTLTFSGRGAGRRVVLAEPLIVLLDPPSPPRLPIKQMGGPTVPSWPIHSGVTIRQKCSFKQALAPPAEPGISKPIPGEEPRHRYEQAVNVPGVQEWTIDLLHRLVAKGQLRPGDIGQDAKGQFAPQHYERIARALEAYLATSGDYTYTLELTRRDPSADPVYDFLCNVKQGHCERFASALAAMLRSLGVPARLVLGYRGADSQGDGAYVVRESHAHAWVEVRVQRPGPGGPQERWLTLDPTPAADRQTADGFWAGLWSYARQGGGAVWQTFIIDYNAERQEAAVLEILDRLGLSDRSRPSPVDAQSDAGGIPSWFWAGVGLAGALAGWWLWRLRRKPNRQSVAHHAPGSLYGRLLAVLARRRSLRPGPAQTPREFADLVGRRLRDEPGAGALADIPEQLTRLYYRVRYAARPLSAAERTEVDQCLEQLDLGLRKK